MQQPTIPLSPGHADLLGTPQDGQWCKLTLRHNQDGESSGIGKFNALVSAFADVRAQGVTHKNMKEWRLWTWAPTAPPEDSP